jgi:hypothetical protein
LSFLENYNKTSGRARVTVAVVADGAGGINREGAAMASHHDYGIDNETFCGGTPDDYDDLRCEVCGASADYETCWQCYGEGGFHDCGEDCCPCAEPELNEECNICAGRGRYLVCIAHPHTEAQIAEYKDRKSKERDEYPDGNTRKST